MDIYQYIMKVQSIAKIGLLFSKDPYALENYEQLQQLSKEMLEQYTGLKLDRPNFFARDIYPTPNISVRTFVFDDQQRILLVKESEWGTWSLPGGWCDLFESPSEAARKEVREEAGYEVEIQSLLGITNRASYLNQSSLCEYTICFLGVIKQQLNGHCHETSEVRFFPLNQLPTISHKYTLQELQRIVLSYQKGGIVFD